LLTLACAGVSDSHNDYGSASKHDAAGIIPGHNITKAGHGDGKSVGRPGETKFDSHDFKENDGFRDTHSEEPNPQNGTKFKFEDHKEDSARSGKDVQVHSSDPNGERVDGNGHYFKESHDGVDVKDANGATDTVHKNTSGIEFHGMFQKHHAGPDNSDAHDSKLTHSGALDSQHQKEEHKDPRLHTMHETSSGKGTWSFNMVGNNALGDLAQESKNWPKQSQLSQTGKPGWGNSLPKNEGEMNEAAKVDWGNTPPKRSDDDMLVEKLHYSNPLLPEPLRILPPSLVEKCQSEPKDPEEEVPECCKKGKHAHPPTEVKSEPEETPSPTVEKRQSEPEDPKADVPECCKKGKHAHSQYPPSGTAPKPEEDASTTVEDSAFELKDAQGNIKHYLWHSGQSIEDMQESAEKSAEILSSTGDKVVEKRAHDPKDPDEVPECCKHRGMQHKEMHPVAPADEILSQPPSDETLVEKRASDAKDPKGCKCKAMQSGSLSKSLLPPSDEALVEKSASGPEDPEEEVPECCKHKGKHHHSSSTEGQPPSVEPPSTQPPSYELLVEKRTSESPDSESPAEKAKGGDALGPGANYMPIVPDLGENMYSGPQTADEMGAEALEHKPTRIEEPYTPSDRVMVVPGGKQTFTPAEIASHATLRDTSKKQPKHPKPIPKAGSMPFGPGSHPQKRSESDDEMLVHKHKFKFDHTTESKMPPSKRGEGEDEDEDEDVLEFPGHPYLVGHAAANAVQANVYPTTVDTMHINAAAYDQEPSPTQLVTRSPTPTEYEQIDGGDIPVSTHPHHIWGTPVSVGSKDKTSIIVMPTREHASHKDDARLNTIQICSAVVMAICLALCLGFLVWWVPRKVRARRSRNRAVTAEMEQRDVELAELNEELDQEVVDAAAGVEKKDRK
jgi:hypothetical protein